MLLILLVILIIIFVLKQYVKQFYKINPTFNIIQLPLSKLSVDIMYEKSPIIINERIVYMEQLVKTVFKYLFVTKKHFKNINKDTLYKNTSRYAILSNKTMDSIVYLFHPSNKKKCLPIKLYKDQCIIIPTFWYYKTDCTNTCVFKLYDLFGTLQLKKN